MCSNDSFVGRITKIMPTNFGDLNDDCLIVIFNCISFRDEIIVAQVCERFQFLILMKWQKKSTCRKISLGEHFWKFSTINAYFPKFIRSISYMIEEIELNTYHLEEFGTLLRSLEFKNIKTCNAGLVQHNINTDEQLLLLSQCFPNLIKLKLRGYITGKYIWEFKELNELHIDVVDVKLKTAYIRRIYNKLKLKKLILYNEDCRTSYGFAKAIIPLNQCKTLEELCIAGDIVHKTITSIKKIKNLRKITAGVLLSFRFIPYPLEDIADHFHTKIESIIFNHVIKDRAEYLRGIERMTNLRKIVLYDDSLTNEQLRYLSMSINKTLEEFYYLKSSRSNLDIEKFIFLITNCSCLKLLDVSGTAVDMALVRQISNVMTNQIHDRDLILRCYDTKINEADIKELHFPENLKISFEKYDIELPEEYFFQVLLKKD